MKESKYKTTEITVMFDAQENLHTTGSGHSPSSSPPSSLPLLHHRAKTDENSNTSSTLLGGGGADSVGGGHEANSVSPISMDSGLHEDVERNAKRKSTQPRSGFFVQQSRSADSHARPLHVMYPEKVIKARDTQIECARAGTTGQTQITNLTADRDLERNIQGQYK